MLKSRTLALLAGIGALGTFYLVPNAIEWRLLPSVGPLVLIFGGDAIGCLAIAIFSRRIATWLYLGTSAVEAALFSLGVLEPASLIWFTDLVPAVVLGLLASAAVVSSDIN